MEVNPTLALLKESMGEPIVESNDENMNQSVNSSQVLDYVETTYTPTGNPTLDLLNAAGVVGSRSSSASVPTEPAKYGIHVEQTEEVKETETISDPILKMFTQPEKIEEEKPAPLQHAPLTDMIEAQVFQPEPQEVNSEALPPIVEEVSMLENRPTGALGAQQQMVHTPLSSLGMPQPGPVVQMPEGPITPEAPVMSNAVDYPTYQEHTARAVCYSELDEPKKSA